MRLPSATAISLDTAPQAARGRLETAARELESQFAQMLLKSMRSASFGDPLAGDSTYRDMYDQQLSRELTKGKGLGLAPMIVRQLERSTAAPTAPSVSAGLPLAPSGAAATPMSLGGAASAIPLGGLQLAPTAAGVSLPAVAPLPMPAPPAPPTPDDVSTLQATGAAEAMCDPTAPLDCSSPEAFVQSIWPHAQRTAKQLGVSAKALVAQAALETGWGRRLVGAGEAASHNLFGIKAGARWVGERVSSATHEFVNGVRQNQHAQFRAYTSAAESFADYAKLLGGSRYAAARGTGEDTQRFASALQEAGYATDPSYAAKITAIANGDTLNRALAALPVMSSTAGNPP